MSTRKRVMMKHIVLAVALAAAGTQMAIADGLPGIGRFSESYAYFNNQPIDQSPSAWRKANPNGLSERRFQASSSEAAAWHAAPSQQTVARARSTETISGFQLNVPGHPEFGIIASR